MSELMVKQVEAIVAGFTLKEGYSVSIEADRYGSARVQVLDHRYESKGQLAFRHCSFEPDFESKLRSDLSFVAKATD